MLHIDVVLDLIFSFGRSEWVTRQLPDTDEGSCRHWLQHMLIYSLL